jgi:hypothetical protein
VCSAGEWYLNGNVDFTGDISVVVRNGCRFNGLTGTHVLTFSCTTLNIETREILANQFPSPLLSLSIVSTIEVWPQWWGAVEGTATNSTIYFEACATQSGSNDIIVDAPFGIEEGDFSNHTLIKRDTGRLDIGNLGTTFGPIISADRFITGDYSALTFTEGTLKGDWFDFFGGVDITQWGDWITSISSNGPKIVNWESGVVEFTNNYSTGHEATWDLVFNIAETCTFKATGAIVVAMARTLTRSYCFDNTSTGEFFFADRAKDGIQYLSNFGSSSAGLLFGLKCGCTIDLDNKEHFLSSGVDATPATVTASRIVNGRISATGSFAETYLLKYDDNLILEGVQISIANATGLIVDNLWNTGSSSETEIHESRFGGSATDVHIKDAGTTNSYIITNTRFSEGLVDSSTKLGSFVATGCYFDNTDLFFTDPNKVIISNNTFIQSASQHSIFMSAPASYTGSGFVITNNAWQGASADYFVTLTDSSGNFGEDYQVKVEGNVGTDVSTTYEINNPIDMSGGDGTFIISDLINLNAMNNSGFFILTQYNWGAIATQTTTAYISNIEAAYFDSGDSTFLAQYRVENFASGGTSNATLSLRRSF